MKLIVDQLDRTTQKLYKRMTAEGSELSLSESEWAELERAVVLGDKLKDELGPEAFADFERQWESTCESGAMPSVAEILSSMRQI